jgi:hypothetical protein
VTKHADETGPDAVGTPVERGVGPHVEAHPPLPTPAAWNCYWKGDNDGPSWDQWHDASDPMPERWEGDPPDEVVPHFTAAQVLEYAGQCVREATAECSQHWRDKVAAELERLANEPPISGNTLAQARVLLAAAQFRGA